MDKLLGPKMALTTGTIFELIYSILTGKITSNKLYGIPENGKIFQEKNFHLESRRVKSNIWLAFITNLS